MLKKPDSSRDRQRFVQWLADCQRNSSIALARNFQIKENWLELEHLRSHVPYWGYALFNLEYEPRSLAVCPLRGTVAVGTKAGDVRGAIWCRDDQRWRPFGITRKQIRKASPSAIRGLLFLDDLRLVAGWALGGFTVARYDAPPGTDPVETCLEPDGTDLDERLAGSERFSRLVHLFPPGSLAPENGDLVLGITRGGSLRVLRQERDGWGVDPLRSKDLPGWDREWGQLADGAWKHNRLWLLSSRGFLIEGELAKPGHLKTLALRKSIRLAAPDEKAVFRRIDACETGLGILAGESVTFRWFEWPSDRPQLREGAVHWFRVPDAMDFTATLPYPPRQPGPELCNGPIAPENPVWLVVSTAQPGLRWVAWARPDSAEPPLPWAAPANFVLAEGGSVLYVGIGRPERGAPPFVACGTRNHKLVIATILDRAACARELTHQVKHVMLAGKEPPEAREALMQSGSGLQWWSLLHRIRGELKGRVEPPLLAELDPEALLAEVDRGHLRTLASRLVSWRRERKEESPDADVRLIDWVLRLLRRANELGQDVDQEIAGLLCTSLQQLDDEMEGKGEAGALAGFLRKWVVYGDTYTEKEAGIRAVYEWNRECGRNLDALVYLTRLLRQRVDPLWAAPPPAGLWTPTVWSLATGQNGEISIASLSDGALVAVAEDGRGLSWIPPEEDLETPHALRLSREGRRLERIDVKDFEDKYQHGPYSRSLWLTCISGHRDECATNREYLLVFCFKGWRRQDVKPDKLRRLPRVYALRLRPSLDAAGKIDSLRIEKVGSQELCNDIYSFCEIASGGESAEPAYTLVAGTSGSWEPPNPEKGWIPLPFIELWIQLGNGKVSIEPVLAPVWRFVEGERSIFQKPTVVPETAYNPCWAVAPSRVPRANGREETWVWAGFQDGHIRGYQRIVGEKKPLWMEGGGTRPSRRGLHLTGGVWRLLELEGQRGKRLLAFGSGDGVIGAVAVADLMENPPERPVPFLIHSRESTPICGLVAFQDLEDGKPCPLLLAATQGGVLCVFSLDYILWEPSERRRGLRFHYPGLRVERFRLNRSLRALSWCGSHPPQFLLGGAEGSVHKYQLELPRYSERRRSRVDDTVCLMETALKRPVSQMMPRGSTAPDPMEWVHRWLRILHVGEGLLRFSIWEELRRAGAPLWRGDETGGDDSPDDPYQRFRQTVERLAIENYRRRPFSKEPAKMLWTEAGKVASAIAYRAIAPETDPDPRVTIRLEQYLELNVIAADLCNRWIGVEQTLESTVLIHSFSSFFDWTAVILLTTDQEPGETADRIRRFLVYNLIQRRLNFTDPVVPLETLRVINVAILRAIVNNRRPEVMKNRTRPFRILPSWQADSASERPSGFFDLMTMVGDLWERFADSLSLTDPLASEILHFFSLCFLLVPDSALLTGQVVSESRLTEKGSALADLILKQAKDLRKELGEIWKDPDEQSALLDQGLELFDAYIRESAALNLAEFPAEGPLKVPSREDSTWPWIRLAQEAREKIRQGVPLGQLSDESMLVEQYQVQLAASWLSNLDRPTQPELASWHQEERTYKDYPEALRWLLDDDSVSKFFTHSRKFLTELTFARQEIRYRARLAKPPDDWRGAQEIRAAIQLCDELLEKLSSAYLFRPQRDHYEKVIRKWRDQLFKRALEAIEVLSLLDQFNRHVYRTSADRLLDNVANLAMQTSPLSFIEIASQQPHNEQPLGHLIRPRLQGYPLILQVFEAGERLVESTHLAGMLLAVARDYIGTSENFLPRPPSSVKAKDVQKSFEDAARRFTLKDQKTWRSDEGMTDDVDIPGTQAIWDLIAGECAWNTSKYSRYSRLQNDGGGIDHFALHASLRREPDGGSCVLISGNVPYLGTLGPDERIEYETLLQKDPQDALRRIKKELSTFVQARKRGHRDERGGGMGLYLIWKITDLFFMSTELLLYDAAWDLGRTAAPLTEARHYPFCVKISWGNS